MPTTTTPPADADTALRIGQRFGMLTVFGQPFFVRHPMHRMMCVCACDCGEFTVTRTSGLLAGMTKSCGCQRGGPAVPKSRQPVGKPETPPDQASDDMLRFFEEHYLPLKLRSRAKNTIRLYRSSVKCFGKTLGRAACLSDLTDEAVSLHLSRLITDGYSPYTVNKERSQLLAMWNWAARKKFVDRWPDVEAERCPTRIPQAWMQGEMGLLMASCQLQRGRICGVLASNWWVSLHMVIWDTGERIGAVRQLKWENLDADGWLLIPAELRKGKREDKHFRLGPDTLQALERIRQPDREMIFPWECHPNVIYRHYRKILVRAGLPTDRRSKFHRLRRTVASNYEAHGGDATALLGHANRSTTKQYLDPRIIKTKQPCEVVYRLPGNT
jgi:integrase